MRHLIVATMVFVLCTSVTGLAQDEADTQPQEDAGQDIHVGAGLKFQSGMPGIHGVVQFGNFGVSLVGAFGGAQVNSQGVNMGLSTMQTLLSGRYVIDLGAFPVKPYVGAGVQYISATANVSAGGQSASSTATAFGFDAFGGLEGSLESVSGLPLSIFADVRYVNVGNMTTTVNGQTVSVPLRVSGIAWSIGARYDFSL